MPCFDARPSVEEENENAYAKIAELTAMLCAVLNELDEKGLSDQILPTASRNGLVDVVGFWNKHRQSDKTRLADQLHCFSVDEQKKLLAMLKEQYEKPESSEE